MFRHKGKEGKGATQRTPAASVKTRIGFDSMLRNGIAYLGDDMWSATVVFTDINYQLATEAQQMEILDRWAKLLNSFESGQSLQMAAYTRTRAMDTVLDDVLMGLRGDGRSEEHTSELSHLNESRMPSSA